MEEDANYKLLEFLKKYQQLIIYNCISTLIFILFPCTFALLSRDSFNHKFWYFEVVLILINLVTFLRFYRIGKLFNKTIRKIEIVDEDFIFETFRFHILKFWCFTPKKIRVKLPELKIHKSEYPLKDKNGEIDKNCIIVKINSNNFYILSHYFDEEIINRLGDVG